MKLFKFKFIFKQFNIKFGSNGQQIRKTNRILSSRKPLQGSAPMADELKDFKGNRNVNTWKGFSTLVLQFNH